MRKSVKGRTKLVTAKGSLKTRSQRSKSAPAKRAKTRSVEGEFEKILQELEDPKNIGSGSWALPRNATTAEKTKYEICEKILGYQEDNNLSDKSLARKLHLTISEIEDILFCRISKFSLDYLVNIAKELFSPAKIRLTIEENHSLNKRRKTAHAQVV